MTLKEAIDALDAIKPNAYTNDQKTAWINSLEGRVQLDVYQMAPGEVVKYAYLTDQNKEMMIPQPYTDIYVSWLWCMVDYYNGETNKYGNSVELYNTQYASFTRYVADTYAPRQHLTDPLIKLGSIDYINDSGTAEELCEIPSSSLLLYVICDVEAEFNAGTSNAIILGTDSDNDCLFGSGDITPGTAGRYGKNARLFASSMGNKLYATYTATGTDPTQGKATFYARMLFAQKKTNVECTTPIAGQTRFYPAFSISGLRSGGGLADDDMIAYHDKSDDIDRKIATSVLLEKLKSMIDGDYIVEPDSDGSSGQVLTTDGAGGRSWTTPAIEAIMPVASATTLGGIKVGDHLTITNGVLSVDTATAVEEDNTKPVTSGAVHMELGNIEALLNAL